MVTVDALREVLVAGNQCAEAWLENKRNYGVQSKLLRMATAAKIAARLLTEVSRIQMP